jgi:hypothetical protein
MDPKAGVRALEEGEVSFSGLELQQTLDSEANGLVILPIMISQLTSSEINFTPWNH